MNDISIRPVNDCLLFFALAVLHWVINANNFIISYLIAVMGLGIFYFFGLSISLI